MLKLQLWSKVLGSDYQMHRSCQDIEILVPLCSRNVPCRWSFRCLASAPRLFWRNHWWEGNDSCPNSCCPRVWKLRQVCWGVWRVICSSRIGISCIFPSLLAKKRRWFQGWRRRQIFPFCCNIKKSTKNWVHREIKRFPLDFAIKLQSSLKQKQLL